MKETEPIQQSEAEDAPWEALSEHEKKSIDKIETIIAIVEEGNSDKLKGVFTSHEAQETIMLRGDENLLEALRLYHGVESSDFSLYVYFARLRDETLQQKYEDIEQRKSENPLADEFEYEIGAYQEELEVHVRNAVRVLWDKGYVTYESGFYGGNLQRIGCEGGPFDDETLSIDLFEELYLEDVIIEVESNAIQFYVNSEKSIEELTDIWNRVVNSLPNNQGDVDSTGVGTAVSFREKQDLLRNQSK